MMYRERRRCVVLRHGVEVYAYRYTMGNEDRIIDQIRRDAADPTTGMTYLGAAQCCLQIARNSVEN